MNFKTIDLHCDTVFGVTNRGNSLYNGDLHINLENGLKLNGYAQFFAFFCSFAKENGPSFFEELYGKFQTALQENEQYVTVCRTLADADAAMAAGKVAAFFSIEGAEGVGCDPGRLDDAWEKGIRLVGLTWNFENALSGSCQTGSGLTDQGREFVRKAQRLGMLVDTSHLSERGFYDICDITEGPVIATHSNSAAVFPHARNLTDDQFRLIMETGGVTGINLFADFLGEAGTVNFETVYQHIDHFLQMGGAANVCLGGDLDGCERLPEGFAHVDDYAKLSEYLLNRGLSEQTVADIYYQNFAKVVKTWNI